MSILHKRKEIKYLSKDLENYNTMTASMKGLVKAISEQNKAVQISFTDQTNSPQEFWFDLGFKVKLEYIKKGECEFDADFRPTNDGCNPIATFIRMIKTQNTPYQKPYGSSCGQGHTPSRSVANAGGSIPPTSGPTQQYQEPIKEMVENQSMARMSALKASSRIFEGTGKDEEMKKFTDEIFAYIQNGIWVDKPKK